MKDFTQRVHGLVYILMERLEDEDRSHKCPTPRLTESGNNREPPEALSLETLPGDLPLLAV